MTIKQRISKFCKKYPDPEQFIVELRWNRKDGPKKQDVGSGKTLLLCWSNNKLSKTVGRPLYIQHYKYDNETKLMEVSYSVLSCNTPKEGEKRKWVYAERYFIPKEEKVLYDINGNLDRYIGHKSYGLFGNAKYFLQDFTRLDFDMEQFKEAFVALTDGHPDLPPRYTGRQFAPWILKEWFIHKKKIINQESKTQKILNDLVANPLEDLQQIIAKSSREDTRTYWSITPKYVYFDSKRGIFRIYEYTHNKAVETHRCYVLGPHKIICAVYKENKWESYSGKIYSAEIINEQDLYNYKYFGYLKSIGTKNIDDIFGIIRHAEIEQLCNMGYSNIARVIASDSKIILHMKDIFGELTKANTVCKECGLTVKQMGTVNFYATNNLLWDYKHNIIELKKVFGNKLLSLDQESFEKCYPIINKLSSWRGNFMDTVPEEHKKTVLMRIANMAKVYNDAPRLYADTRNMFLDINTNNRPNVEIWKIKKYEDLVRTHDSLVEINRIEREERNRLWKMQEEERNKTLAKKMADIDEARKLLNYEEDDFLIRIPKNLGEITNEGSELSHCVGSYVQAHALGSTTILFLRKKSNPEKPFYTIEMANNKIKQIHGFGNKWLGNDPEAIPTVVRWMRANNISCENSILLSTAKGYFQTNAECIEMPEI